MKNQNECRECDGAGIIDTNCGGCEGAGEIDVYYDTVIIYSFADVTEEERNEAREAVEPCYRCDGEGVFDADCTPCEGSGVAA